MTVAIPLSRGRFALVDDEDAERVIAAGPWHTRLAPRTAYARHNHLVDGRFVTVLMHRFITGWEYVDHINGDGLDNRRANLRQATRGQNLANIGLKSNKPAAPTTSACSPHPKRQHAPTTPPPSPGMASLPAPTTPRE